MLRASWLLHQEAKKQTAEGANKIATEQLRELATRGSFFFERAALPPEGATEFANFWEGLAGRWTEGTRRFILQNFGEEDSKSV